MPAYEWSKEHNAFIKECGNKNCPTKIFIGAEDEQQSISIFLKYFARDVRGHGDGFYNQCLDCKTARDYSREVINKEALLAYQNGKCAICGKGIHFNGRGTAGTTARIDHIHGTETVRGILCHPCNILISILDNKSLHMAAHKYLINPPAKRFKSRGA